MNAKDIPTLRIPKTLIYFLCDKEKEEIYKITLNFYNKLKKNMKIKMENENTNYIEEIILCENEIRLYPNISYENIEKYSYIGLSIDPNFSFNCKDAINIYITVNKKDYNIEAPPFLQEFHELNYKICEPKEDFESYESIDKYININSFKKFYGIYENDKNKNVITEYNAIIKLIFGIIRENRQILEEDSAEKMMTIFKNPFCEY